MEADIPPSLARKMVMNHIISVALSYVPSHLPNNVNDDVLLLLSLHGRPNTFIRVLLDNTYPQIGSFLSSEISSSAYGKSTCEIQLS
jgi:hypothetical protein